jgi:hypothetical protein
MKTLDYKKSVVYEMKSQMVEELIGRIFVATVHIRNDSSMLHISTCFLSREQELAQEKMRIGTVITYGLH